MGPPDANLYGWLHASIGDGLRLVLVYGSLVTLCWAVIVVGRWSRRQAIATARRVDRVLAGGLTAIWVTMLTVYLAPSRFHWTTSLPLHVCQCVALAAPIALLTRRRLPRAIVYYWGLGLSTQAFVHVQYVGALTHLDTYVGWGFHETNLAAAAYDLIVRRYRPTWRDWRLNAAAISAYVVVVGSLDAAMGADYGMIGPHVIYPPLAAFGPWPGRMVWLALTATAVTAGLTLVWPRNWKGSANVVVPPPQPLPWPRSTGAGSRRPARAA